MERAAQPFPSVPSVPVSLSTLLNRTQPFCLQLLSADESVADVTLWDAMERAAQPFPSVPAPSVTAAPQSQVRFLSEIKSCPALPLRGCALCGHCSATTGALTASPQPQSCHVLPLPLHLPLPMSCQQAADSSSVWPNNVGERVCIVSGLSGIEIMDLVEIISSLDIPPMVYAAMVPKSAARPVREVVEDLVADHRLLYSQSE
ncbi:unnamed protein product [Closterium sp. NIES-53]